MAPFFIRNLVCDDVSKLIALPKDEGREMGTEPEIETWLKVDPNGIFIAIDVEDGQIAGCCSAIILSESHGYIGMYVVGKKHRGGGLGRILWQAAVSHLGGRNTCLSSVDRMVQCYREKAGFEVVADWTVDLYFGNNLTLASSICNNLIRFPALTFIVQPGDALESLVTSYDLSVHGYDRSSIVSSTVSERGTLTLVAIGHLLDGCSSVVGYASMKKSLQGHWLIAPLYADDYSSAHSLLHGLISHLTIEQRLEGVVAKLVSSNLDSEKLFHNFGLKKTKYQLQRLFTQKVFDIPESRIFALQSSIFCTE